MSRVTQWMGEHAAVVDNHVNYIDLLARYEDMEEQGKLVSAERIEAAKDALIARMDEFYDEYRRISESSVDHFGGKAEAMDVARRLVVDAFCTLCPEGGLENLKEVFCMQLKDTAVLMNSADYKERFRAEYLQLRIRALKLGDMLSAYQAGSLSFKPTCPISVLNKQYKVMLEYLEILEQRALIEDVSLAIQD